MNDRIDEARELLFGDALVCRETRAAAFLPGACDEPTLRAEAMRGEALLRALAVIEDSSPRAEEPEQHFDHALLRIEAKIDLLTALLAGVCAGEHGDPVRELEWSALGACLQAEAALPAGTAGRFRVRPADWLPSPLLLPATVLASRHGGHGGARLWLRFDAGSPALQSALERHLFRIHRRAIAESRRRAA